MGDPKWPTRRAFELVAETCPVVQKALDDLTDDLLSDYGDEEKIPHRHDRTIQRLKAAYFAKIEAQTTALRTALIDALTEVQELREAEVESTAQRGAS